MDAEIAGVHRPLLYLGAMIALVGCFGGGRDAESGDFRHRECTSGFSCESEASRAKTPAEAERLYKRSCDLDYVGGCFALGYAYREGKLFVDYHDVPIPKNPEGAFAAYEHACGLKDGGKACLHALDMIAKGESTRPVEPFVEKACDGDATSREDDTCGHAGDARLAANDEDRALALYKRGCEHTHGAPASCLGLASILIKRGKPADAEGPLGDACFFGKSGKACTEAGKLAAAKGDIAEAARKLGDACRLGEQEGCALSGDANKARDAERRLANDARDRQWEEERKKAAALGPAAPSAPGTTSGGPQKIRMNDATANGVRAKSLDCTLQGGNLLSSFVLLAGLGDRTASLRACGIKKAFTADWTMSNGTITTATAKGTGSPAGDACATRALRQMKQGFTGTCTAELEVQ